MEKKETKTMRLKRMYKDLANGWTVKVNGCTIFRARNNRNTHDLFFWHCYGSSACSVSLNSLRWICKEIACSDNYEYERI